MDRATPLSRFTVAMCIVWMGIGLFGPDRVLCAASNDSLAFRYNRGLNTDAWTGLLNYRETVKSGIMLSIYENLNSSRLKVRTNENKWKDQHHLLFSMVRIVNPALRFNLKGSSYIFSDYQSGYVNDIRTHSVVAGSRLDWRRIRFPVEFGVKEDRRYHRRDPGWTYLCGAEFTGLNWSDYTNTLLARLDGDFLGKRRNKSLRMQYDVSRQFHIDTYDSLRLNYSKYRQDYYVSDAGEIESRNEQTQGVENILSYRFMPGLRFAFEGQVSSRQMRIHQIQESEKGLKRKRSDLRTQSKIRFIWKTKALSGNIYFGYAGEDQTYQLGEFVSDSPYAGSSALLTPDNQSLYTTLALRNHFLMGRADTLFVMASLQRFRYDTPDPDNMDDRDEIRIRSECALMHRFSPNLSSRIALRLHLLHLVYIFSEKSADNNWTRILRLNPVVKWRPKKRIQWIQSAEVLANYVDYDFDAVTPDIRSFLYRKFQLDDTLQTTLTQNSALLLSYRLELDENGKLLWRNWLEQRVTDRRSQTLNLTLTYKTRSHVTLMPGYAVYTRMGNRYEYDPAGGTLRQQYIDFRSHGPVMRIFYRGNRLRVTLSGSTVRTQSIGIADQLLTRIDMHMRWAL